MPIRFYFCGLHIVMLRQGQKTNLTEIKELKTRLKWSMEIVPDGWSNIFQAAYLCTVT